MHGGIGMSSFVSRFVSRFDPALGRRRAPAQRRPGTNRDVGFAIDRDALTRPREPK
jgi:hypothetical protein